MVADQKEKQESKTDTPQDVFKDVTYFIVGDVSQDVSLTHVTFYCRPSAVV